MVCSSMPQYLGFDSLNKKIKQKNMVCLTKIIKNLEKTNFEIFQMLKIEI